MIIGDDWLWLSLETNHCVSVCTTCLLVVCGVQVWRTKTFDGHGEGQIETGRVDEPEALKDKREAWTKGPGGQVTSRGG